MNCIQNIDGDIWIGAGSNLLSRLDERTEAIDNYSGSAFNFGAVHCLLKYTDKELLVGTDNGLYLFDQNTNTFQRADNPADPEKFERPDYQWNDVGCRRGSLGVDQFGWDQLYVQAD